MSPFEKSESNVTFILRTTMEIRRPHYTYHVHIKCFYLTIVTFPEDFPQRVHMGWSCRRQKKTMCTIQLLRTEWRFVSSWNFFVSTECKRCLELFGKIYFVLILALSKWCSRGIELLRSKEYSWRIFISCIWTIIVLVNSISHWLM